MIVKMKDQHRCRNPLVLQSHHQIDSDLIAEVMLPIVKDDINISVASIQSTIDRDYHHKVSYWKAWLAKQKILERLFGTHEESFQLLPKLLLAIKECNPGTIVDWDHKLVDGNRATFGRVFWAFGAAIKGFKYLRPLISIDGTHLYGKYKAKLLIAVAYDANNGVYPLCFAIVEEETNDNWRWFLDLLRRFVCGARIGMCIISDRHAAIKNSMAQIFPEPIGYHRYCSRHFVSNFNSKFRNVTLKNL